MREYEREEERDSNREGVKWFSFANRGKHLWHFVNISVWKTDLNYLVMLLSLIKKTFTELTSSAIFVTFTNELRY